MDAETRVQKLTAPLPTRLETIQSMAYHLLKLCPGVPLRNVELRHWMHIAFTMGHGEMKDAMQDLVDAGLITQAFNGLSRIYSYEPNF